MSTLTQLPEAGHRLARAAGESVLIALAALYRTSDRSERTAHLAAIEQQLQQAAEHLLAGGDAVGAAELRGPAAMVTVFADIERAAIARQAAAGGVA
jgi:hypothetical protein